MHVRNASLTADVQTHGDSNVGNAAVALLETLDVLADLDGHPHSLVARNELSIGNRSSRGGGIKRHEGSTGQSRSLRMKGLGRPTGN
jgi:hypothetical protein